MKSISAHMKSIGKMKKRGNLNLLVPSIIVLVVAAVVLTLGVVINQELRDTQTAGTDAFEAANDTLVGLASFSDFWTIIVIAIVAVIIIGLIVGLLGAGRIR